jgi:hypothetical protein
LIISNAAAIKSPVAGCTPNAHEQAASMGGFSIRVILGVGIRRGAVNSTSISTLQVNLG